MKFLAFLSMPDVKDWEIMLFAFSTALIGALSVIRLCVIELIEMTQTMLEYTLSFHGHVKRFREKLRNGKRGKVDASDAL